MKKEIFFKTIKNNIDVSGFHITVVKSSENPRFAYTIGMLKKVGFELIIAGAENFLYDDIIKILNEFVITLDNKHNHDKVFEVSELGKFTLSSVDKSWTKKMLLGVFDYYNIENFDVFQIVPKESNHAKDIPNMSKPWSIDNIIWKWLDDTVKWDLPVPKDSKVITEVKVLLGEKVTEVMRWEENEWEGFTQNGESVKKNDIRIVPIATLLGIDQTLMPILNLDKERGLWRDDGDSDWNNWE